MFFFFWLMFAAVVGVFAANRGRSGFGWFLLSLVISPLLGFLFVAVSKNLKEAASVASSSQGVPGPDTHVRCSACAEWVLPMAAVCKHCGANLVPDPDFDQRKAAAAQAISAEDNRNLVAGVSTVAIVIAVVALIAKCSG